MNLLIARRPLQTIHFCIFLSVKGKNKATGNSLRNNNFTLKEVWQIYIFRWRSQNLDLGFTMMVREKFSFVDLGFIMIVRDKFFEAQRNNQYFI